MGRNDNDERTASGQLAVIDHDVLEFTCMDTACHYAIVRFMPFVETCEFGNMGIVLFSPTARYFGSKLLGQRYSRITNFFEQLDAKLFRASMHAAQAELQRVSNMLKGLGTDRRLKALDREAAVSV